MRKSLDGSGASRVLVAMVALVASCHRGGGGQLGQPPKPEMERASHALISSDIDRVLGFESTSPTDWAVIQSGRGVLGVSTSQSQGFRALTVAARGYVPIESVALPSLGTRVGNVIHIDVWVPSEVNSTSPLYHGALQLNFSIPSLGVNNEYLGQAELTPLPVDQWSTLSFTPTSQQVSKLSGSYSDLRFVIAINSPATDANPYLNYQVDNLRVSDQTRALVTVVDKEGHAISGATVVAYNGSTATGHSAVSDSIGLAGLWVPVGNYRFAVAEAGATYFSANDDHCHAWTVCGLNHRGQVPWGLMHGERHLPLRRFLRSDRWPVQQPPLARGHCLPASRGSL